MTTKLHHKSKRYEVQTYSTITLAWLPVAHTDSPAIALNKVRSITVKGSDARVLDRLTRTVAVTANKVCKNTKNPT